jgi:hypothetical protein
MLQGVCPLGPSDRGQLDAQSVRDCGGYLPVAQYQRVDIPTLSAHVERFSMHVSRLLPCARKCLHSMTIRSHESLSQCTHSGLRWPAQQLMQLHLATTTYQIRGTP